MKEKRSSIRHVEDRATPGKYGKGESVRLNMENTVANRMGPKPVPSDRAPNKAPCIAP